MALIHLAANQGMNVEVKIGVLQRLGVLGCDPPHLRRIQVDQLE